MREQRMAKFAGAIAGAVTLGSCVSSARVPSEVRADLAPSGTLRAAINYGNPVLVQGTPAAGEPRGISVDLGRELGRRIGVPVELVPYTAAGQVTDAVKTGAWDLAFLAVDPTRANDLVFTAPYLEIEGTYLVPAGSPLHAIADVDRQGVRVAVGAKSAYDLFLTRTLTRAQIVRAPSAVESIALFTRDKLDAVAGVRQALAAAARDIPGARVMDDRFMVIAQAAAVPKGRDAAAKYVREFIEDVKASGFVAESLKRSGVDGVTLAPLAHD
jgi:polar amino acid transport system substrate-binding protein